MGGSVHHSILLQMRKSLLCPVCSFSAINWTDIKSYFQGGVKCIINTVYFLGDCNGLTSILL